MNGVLLGAIGGAGGALAMGGIGALIDKTRRVSPTGKRSRLSATLAAIGGVAGARILIALAQPSAEDQLDSQSPEFATLHRYYPDQYAQIIALAKNNPSDPVALRNSVAPIIGGIVNTRRAQLNDDNSRRLVKLILKESAVVRDKDALSCVGLLGGGKVNVDLGTVMTPDIIKEDSDNTAAALQQLATDPAPSPPPLAPDVIKRLAIQGFSSIPKDEQTTLTPVLQASRQPQNEVEGRAYCDFSIALFQDVLKNDPGQLRSLLAAGP